MKSTYPFIVAMICAFANGFAQDRKIVARIVDSETQKGIKDVNVVIAGTPNGTTTNALGYFELNINPKKHKSIIVSHIGFKTSEIAIPDQDRFKYVLQKEFIPLGRIDLRDYPTKENELPQTENKPSAQMQKKQDGETLVVVESGASFPGGTKKFLDLVGNALSTILKETLAQDILMNFTVSDSGKVSNVLLSDTTKLKTAAFGFLKDVPSWTPATQRGRPVPQYFSVGIGQRFVEPTIADFYKFIGQTVKYPLKARQQGIEGVVIIEFEIEPAGRIVATSLQEDIGGECGKEVTATLLKVPLEITAGLADKDGTRKFVFPVTFSFEKPWDRSYFVNIGDAILLNAVMVTAIGSNPPRR